MVPEQTDEKQEKFAAAGGASCAEQQQQFECEQPQSPRRTPPRAAPRGAAPCTATQTSSVTRAFLWDLLRSPRYSKLSTIREGKVPKDKCVECGRT